MSDVKWPKSPVRVSPQPTPKIGRSERTRSAILEAGFGFLWSRPFRDMTVSALMAPTSVGRAAFYQYFDDLHGFMETLLDMLKGEIFDAAASWVAGVGDPVALVNEALTGVVRVSYRRGPFLRAITDAATTDERLEKSWGRFLIEFDDAACARIEEDQRQGLIPAFDARPVAFALNRLDAYTLIEAFGQRPRSRPEPVRKALARVWISTLYGAEWLGKEPSGLLRR